MSGEGGEGGDAPAPVEEAPEGAAPAEAAPAAKAPPKPRTIDDDLEDLLRKHGGYEYAKGKKLGSATDLKRMLGRGHAAGAVESEALKRARVAEERDAKAQELAKMAPRQRLAALKDLGIDPRLIQEGFEEDVLAKLDEEEASKGMSQREREMAATLRAQEEKLTEMGRAERERAEAAEKAQRMEEIEALGQRMEEVAGRVLQAAGIPREHADTFLPGIANRLDRAARLSKLNPDHVFDEQAVVESVIAEREELADQHYGALSVEKLAEKLGSVEVDDPARPGTKISRLKLLMRHEASKIKARLSGAPQVHSPRPQSTNGVHEETDAEKMARARTFGGGGTW